MTPLELGVGPTAAVWDIGDTQEVEDTVTPLMVTSVGALISRTGAGVRGAALGGGPGGRGWGLRGTIVARRGARLLGDTVRDRVLLVRGGGIGGTSVVSWIEITGVLCRKEGREDGREILERGHSSLPRGLQRYLIL